MLFIRYGITVRSNNNDDDRRWFLTINNDITHMIHFTNNNGCGGGNWQKYYALFFFRMVSIFVIYYGTVSYPMSHGGGSLWALFWSFRWDDSPLMTMTMNIRQMRRQQKRPWHFFRSVTRATKRRRRRKHSKPTTLQSIYSSSPTQRTIISRREPTIAFGKRLASHRSFSKVATLYITPRLNQIHIKTNDIRCHRFTLDRKRVAFGILRL